MDYHFPESLQFGRRAFVHVQPVFLRVGNDFPQADVVCIGGLDDFVMGENLFLMLNGEIFDGDWTYEVSSNDLSITFTVPEPAVFAMAIGTFAFGLAQWRRRL